MTTSGLCRSTTVGSRGLDVEVVFGSRERRRRDVLARQAGDDGATQTAARAGHRDVLSIDQAGVDAASLQPYWRS